MTQSTIALNNFSRGKARFLGRRALSNLMFVAVLMICVFFFNPVKTVGAASPKGVDHLRGRWDGVIENLNDTDQPFRLFLNDFAPDPNDSEVMLANGCLAVGEVEALTPIAAQAVNVGEDNFSLTVLGTVAGNSDAFTIRLTGLAETFEPGVSDDRAGGEWVTAEDQGNWSATHHDRRRSHCPSVDNIPGLYFYTNLAVHHRYDGELVNRSTLMQGETNIVSSAMLVQRPDGTTTVVPFFTSIFTPDVDFISKFGYEKNEPGDAISGEAYTFSLLDVLGHPIPGTTDTDIWTVCLPTPPRNLLPTVLPDFSIDLSWDTVPITPGFDPANQIGFYQVWINPWPTGGPFVYGANFVSSTRHIIPWDSFEGPTPGVPDGFDNGVGLSELDNGDYEIGGDSISVPTPGNLGHGTECIVTDFAEKLFFTKADAGITFFTP